MTDLEQFVRQSPYSTPGRHTARLETLPDGLATLCAASRNVIGHYRAEFVDLPVVEYSQQGRWLRADPELLGPGLAFDAHDMPKGSDAPFETAAEAWLGWRAGDRDLSTYGVAPDTELCGPRFVRSYVIFEVAHRYGDEMLLWDGWGATEEEPSDLSEIDELAQLLVRADGGDHSAETELFARYREDDRLHPGDSVVTYSPFGRPPRTVQLRAPL